DIRRCRFIGVLDMAGFEILSINSFEQLCINFTNERLQQFFNHFMFIREQSEYDAEQIQWDYIDFGLDLQPAIDLIEKPLGLLSLLEEECVVPKGSDLSLAEKLCQAHLGKSAPFGKPRPSQKSRGVAHFSIAHYAGVVSYNIDGWLDKNRDPLSESLLEMLAGSTHPLMQQIFKIDPQTAALGRRRRQSLASLTVSSVYKDQLGNLLSTLNSTNPHFIRCIVPNYERMPGLIDGPLVLQQLRCNGVLEGIRICRRGYPNRLLFEEFVNRYRILHPKSTDGCSNDWKRAAEQLCEAIGLVPHTQYQLGVTKVFCRVGLIGQLESMRNEKLSKLVCGLQARIRWYFEQIELDNRYAEWEALLLIQKAVRHHVVVRKWPWYRLMQLVAPMVPKEREKVMIEDLTVERDALKELVGRLEGENADLINKVRSLEKRVSEMLDVNRRQDCEIETMREEMQKQEDLLATLQHNLSEQEHKLMNLHSTLSEEQSRIQELRDGNALLEKDMESMKQSLQKERGAREQMELNQKLAHVQLKEMEEALTETESVKISLESQLEMREKENEELKARVNQQLETIKSMQSQIFDQSSRVSAAESQLHAERMAKKKAENEKLITDEVIADLQKSLDHAEKKAALLKEKWRVKDVEVGKLNKKLTDSTDQLDFCVSDMKKRHAATHKVLQDQLEEYRRKSLKLESENKQLKAKVEVSLNSFERESSIDSDYGSGARILSRRHTTQNSHSSMRRSQTHLDSLSFHAKVREEISTLTQRFTKSGSSNDMQNRRLDELERELRSVQTDKRLLTREIDVYKRTIHDETLEKEALSKQVKGLVVDVNQLNKALMKEEEHSIDLERKLRKTQNDVTHYKAKYEDTLVEKDNEVNLERKRMQQKLDEVVHEHQLKSNQIAIVHKTKDELQTELVETQAELDRAYASIAQLEKLHDSQGKVADTWGTQYKMASGELEALREENNNLRTRLRRQQRELDTLRETSTPDNEANMLEGEIQRLRDELMSSSTISQEDGVSPSNSSSSVHTRRSSIYGNRYED
uniref:Myosin motor domain-containing protein n=1 Tax=Plectus sambesii TaxID=2011161 RepID=A0A914V7I8_9BILA